MVCDGRYCQLSESRVKPQNPPRPRATHSGRPSCLYSLVAIVDFGMKIPHDVIPNVCDAIHKGIEVVFRA